MNPDLQIAPPMPNNEALRRILARFVDVNGNPIPGSPGGPLLGSFDNVIRVAATGPLPTLATLLTPARIDRRTGFIHNLDDTNDIWFSSDPNVTNLTGTTLDAGLSIPFPWAGPIYIYCIAGGPIVEFTEIYG